MSTTVTIPTITQSGVKGEVSRTISAGTAGTSVTATEHRAGQNLVVALTFTTKTVEPIVGAADEAIGILLYTLPAGNWLIRGAYMNIALSNTTGNVNADTPEVGLGTVQGNGANATLGDAGVTAENIIEGQVATNVTGSYTEKGEDERTVTVQADDPHTIYLNVADGWAGADANIKATGTVLIECVALS